MARSVSAPRPLNMVSIPVFSASTWPGGRSIGPAGAHFPTTVCATSMRSSALPHTDTVQLDLSYTGANNTLNGQGSAPVQELAITRSLVFTGPQTNVNRLNFITLNANAAISDSWSAQGVLYYRDYSQVVANGDTSDYEACDDGSGTLCQPDGATPLTNAQGLTFPDISDGGTVPIGQNDYESIHAWGRGGTLQLSNRSDHRRTWQPVQSGRRLRLCTRPAFSSGTQIGVINPQLSVLPSNLIVSTPEDSDAAAEIMAIRRR